MQSNFKVLSRIIRQKKDCFFLQLNSLSRVYRVLGIETSCDDTAVAIVDSNRQILSSRCFNDKNAILAMGGIFPLHFAHQHRTHINRLVNDCIEESGLRASDLDAVSVSSRPGIIISLKVGIEKALSLARENYLKMIPVHHMRAHALVARLQRPDLEFPFLALLISGGHSLIVLVNNAESFEILGESLSGSPGECLDKLARALNLQPVGPHFASTIEKLAEMADKEGHLKFPVKQPSVPGADFDFSRIKSSYLSLINRQNPSHYDVPNVCASIQFAVMSHLCKKLDSAFQFLANSRRLSKFHQKKRLVVAGGVASNAYFIKCIQKLALLHKFELVVPSRKLCTDNGEMIAWLGMELLLSSSKDIFYPAALPDNLIVYSRNSIGTNLRKEMPKRPPRKLKLLQLH